MANDNEDIDTSTGEPIPEATPPTMDELIELEAAAEAGNLEAQERLVKIEGVEDYAEYQRLTQEIVEKHRSLGAASDALIKNITDNLQPGMADSLKITGDWDRVAREAMSARINMPEYEPLFPGSHWVVPAHSSEERLADEIAKSNRLNREILREMRIQRLEERARIAESAQGKPENRKLPRVPKQLKRLNDWKAAWLKVKGRWKRGNETYQDLSTVTGMSAETTADIVRAGDAGLLD